MSGNALWILIKQSDAISKFVLLLLLGMSIACWAIFFYKIILLRIKKKQLMHALAHLKEMQKLEDLLTASSNFTGTLPGYLLARHLQCIKSALQSAQTPQLSTKEWEYVQYGLSQNIDDMVQHEETYLPLLSTSAEVAPLLGLFGTVWGLVHAFIRISQQQSADIATVAPGIAEALITTLVGLIVAIPALLMFNYLTVQVRVLEQQFMAITDKVGSVVQRLVS